MTSIVDWTPHATSQSKTDTLSGARFEEGQSGDSVNNDARDNMFELRSYFNTIGGVHSAIGGTADAITATTLGTATYAAKSNDHDGLICRFIAGAANTATNPTFALDSMTATTIVLADGSTSLQAGDIANGKMHTLIYERSADVWLLMDPAVTGYAGQAVGTSDSPTFAGGTFSAAVAVNVNGSTAVSALADDFVVRTENGNCGISIMAADGSTSNLFLGSTSDNDRWRIRADHTTTDFSIGNGTTDRLVWDESDTQWEITGGLEVSGSVRGRIPLSAETSDTLTVASANKKILASSGITIPASVFTAHDTIIIEGNGTARTITRGSGLTMYVDGSDSASATLAANGLMAVSFRSATVAVLTGDVS